MSYEGYERYLCRKGHTWCVDAMEVIYEFCKPERADEPKCPTCKEPAIWARSVDQTNGCTPEYGCFDPPLEVDKPAVYEVCNLGHQHLKPGCEETYHIPKDGRRLAWTPKGS